MKPTHSARMFSQLAACLDPDKLYAVSMLVALAERHHLLPIDPTGQDQTRTAKMRLFVYINRLIGLHPKIFPESDGQFVIDGQAPLNGYKGWRFQKAATKVGEHRRE